MEIRKRNLEVKVGACTIENFCDMVSRSEENWNNMASYAKAWLKAKKFELGLTLIHLLGYCVEMRTRKLI